MQEALNYVIDDTFNRVIYKYPNYPKVFKNLRESIFNELQEDLSLHILWVLKELVEY